jgi:Mannosyltransferase (PIG-V)
MSGSGLTSDTDVAVPGRPAQRWSVPRSVRLSLPATAAVVYLGIRALGLVVVAFLLRHGAYQRANLSLEQWIIGGDGAFYRSIAAHGYDHGVIQQTRFAIFASFPGYPAAIDSLAWLPGVSIASAGFAVTLLAGMAAAWGLATLGLKLTADSRISLIMVAIWAVAPGCIALSRVHSEALFCALAVWALVALVDHRWLTAGVLVMLAGTVRSTALALVGAVAVAVVLALIQAARTRQRIGAWWRPVAALLLAPLGLLGYWGYVAWVTHRPDGWFWIEEHRFGISFDWGKSTIRVIPGAFLDQVSVAELLVVLAILGAVALTAWSLTERIPVYLHVYTVVVAIMAFTISANWLSEKPRYFLPAVLLALPVARLLAPLRTSILVPLIIVLTLASTWIGVYLLVIARLAS